jgi:nucleosome binding factor SPN SPT16 subunit
MVLPTVNCLVELTQMPFTVVSLGDIEIVNLERVGFNLKNFDMAIVFKVQRGEAATVVAAQLAAAAVGWAGYMAVGLAFK